ncbi:MAG: carboxypeptidase regulatory-like domain-containing protein, partial [bacterium]
DPVLESLPEWKSGADGRFTFQAADGAVLEASRGALRGWARIDRGVLIMKTLTIRLGHPPPRDATITGRVRDAAGAPLAEAMVRAQPSEYYSTSPTVVTTTGPDGRFTLAGVDRAQYDLTAEAADHLKGALENVRGGSRDVDLALDPGQAISGQVVDRYSAPVPSFTLTVQRIEGLARAHVTTLSLIDPQGHFTVRVAKGDYDLVASATDHVRTTVQAAAGAGGVRIVLDSGAILRGRITAEDGTPVGNAFVGVQSGRGGPRTPMAVPIASTRGDGTFELVGLGPGALGLEVFSPGFARQTVELPAVGADGARPPVAVALAPGGPTFDRPRAENSAGIGVQIMPYGDGLRIVGVLPGSGAEAAGLVVGDQIVAINGVPVAGMGIVAATDRIRGAVGTSVMLTLRREGHDVVRAVERRPLRS